MSVKSLPRAPHYQIAKVPVMPPERKPAGEPRRTGFAVSQSHETLGLDLQRAPVALPSGSEPSEIGSEASEIKVEIRETSSAVYINRIVELARRRATLISKIRELLLRGETQEAIPLVRVLCGLED